MEVKRPLTCCGKPVRCYKCASEEVEALGDVCTVDRTVEVRCRKCNNLWSFDVEQAKLEYHLERRRQSRGS